MMQALPRAPQSIFQSLLGFLNAPHIERRCLYVIAIRTDPADLQQYRAAFDEADADGNGRVTQAELRAFIESARHLYSVWVDADALFSAMDVPNTGVIEFAEFAAACLHEQLSPLDDWLVEQAFESLDINKDGLVQPQEVKRYFGKLPVGLPTGRPLTLDQWRESLLAHMIDFEANQRAATEDIGPSTPRLSCADSTPGPALVNVVGLMIPAFQSPKRESGANANSKSSIWSLMVGDFKCCGPVQENLNDQVALDQYNAVTLIDNAAALPLAQPQHANSWETSHRGLLNTDSLVFYHDGHQPRGKADPEHYYNSTAQSDIYSRNRVASSSPRGYDQWQRGHSDFNADYGQLGLYSAGQWKRSHSDFNADYGQLQWQPSDCRQQLALHESGQSLHIANASAGFSRLSSPSYESMSAVY